MTLNFKKRILLMLNILLVFLMLISPAVVDAQPKPVGAFSSEGAPSWISFGSLAGWSSYEDMVKAAERSRTTGFRWVLQMGFGVSPIIPSEQAIAADVARAKASGLWPYVIGLTYNEEWYERFYAGEFAPYGFPASRPDGIVQIHAWMSRQHCALGAATGKPVVWLTGVVTRSHPVPSCTDVVAVEAYVPDGSTFDQFARPVVLEAEATTTLPLVLVTRWFQMIGPKQGPFWHQASAQPTKDTIDGYAAVLNRPQWIAMWGFLWASRPSSDALGLADLPNVRKWVEQSLGIVP